MSAQPLLYSNWQSTSSRPNVPHQSSSAPRTSSQTRRSSATSTSRQQPQSLHSQLSHSLPHPLHQLTYFQQHTAELAAYITQIFLPSVLPTAEEYQVCIVNYLISFQRILILFQAINSQIKEQTRQYLETLADKVSPGARLLPFGSIGQSRFSNSI